MLIIEKERVAGRFRVWSEENGVYVMLDSTGTAVQNFFRSMATQRADMFVKDRLAELKDAPVEPRRSPKLVM